MHRRFSSIVLGLFTFFGLSVAAQAQGIIVPIICDVTLVSFSAAQAPATTSIATVAMSVFMGWFCFVCAGLAGRWQEIRQLFRVRRRTWPRFTRRWKCGWSLPQRGNGPRLPPCGWSSRIPANRNGDL